MVNLLNTCRSFGSNLFSANRKLMKCSNWINIREYQGSDSGAYAGDGNTTVNVLQSTEPHVNLVNTYSAHGFRLSNNLYINGSILIFPTHVFSWSVRKGSDITVESLRIFDLIVPRVKILVIGYGQQGEPYDSSLPLKLKISDAVHVAGAFVTVRGEVKSTKRDRNVLYEELYERDWNADLPYEEREKLDDVKKFEKIHHAKGKGKTSFDP